MSQAIAFTAPILPGKTDVDRAAMTSVQDGERTEAHRASRERHGITRESAWIQSTPQGDFVVVLIEADDIGAAMAGVAASEDPFDAWFRDHIAEVHGMDVTEGPPPLEQILDFRA